MPTPSWLAEAEIEQPADARKQAQPAWLAESEPDTSQPAPEVSTGAAAWRGAEKFVTLGARDKIAGLAGAYGDHLQQVGDVNAKNVSPTALAAVRALNGDRDLIPGLIDTAKTAAAEHAAGKSWVDVLSGTPVGGRPFGDTYADARDEAEATTKAAQAQHPWAFGVGGVVGGLLTAPVLGSARVAQGAGTAARLGQAALTGAKFGAANAAGEAHADDPLAYLKEIAKGGGFGAVGGALVQGGGELAGKAVRGIANFAKEQARNRAIKAAGAIQSDLKLLRRQAGGADAGAERMATIADDLHDLGLMKPGMTPDKIRVKADEMRQEAGAKIGAIYETLDLMLEGTSADAAGAVKPSADAIVASGAKLLKRLRSNPWSQSKATADSVERELLNIVEQAQGGTIGFRQLHGWRSALDDILYGLKSTQVPGEKATGKALGEIRNAITQELEGKVAGAGKVLGAPGLIDDLQQANGHYSTLAQVGKWAAQADERSLGNHFFGLTSAIGGAAGGGFAAMLAHAMGGGPEAMFVAQPIGAVAGAVGNKLRQEHGDVLSAWVANKGAEALPGLAQGAMNAAGRLAGPIAPTVSKWLRGDAPPKPDDPADRPVSPMQQLNAVAQQVPELQQAKQQGGPQQMAAEHYARSQSSPEYRAIQAHLNGDKDKEKTR